MTSKLTDETKSTGKRKLALVIGNEKYDDKRNLRNAVNDAIDVTNALKQIGFIIDGPKLNVTLNEMEQVVINFENSLEIGDLALFYFSGHGTQWKVSRYK